MGILRACWFVLALMGAIGMNGCEERASENPPAEVNPPGTLVLEWEAPTHRIDGQPLEGLAGYLIQIGTSPERFDKTIPIGPWPRYTVTGLKPGQRYYVRIAAYDRYGRESAWSEPISHVIPFPQRINFVPSGTGRTPNPPGWIAYDGAPYHPDRGFGWLEDVRGQARDRGVDAPIVLANGQITTPAKLRRPELATMHSLHGENRLRVFRIDLPNGWYRVTCSSVDPGGPLPLVNQRSFKCRSGDVVFAGPAYGSPLAVKGNALVEGAGIVEVRHNHLRIVIGDPAYGEWTWQHHGPWYTGWRQWLKKGHLYANGWLQKITRRVDPGYHSLRLNALQIEPSAQPPASSRVVFSETFQRDDGKDVNDGVAAEDRWIVADTENRLVAEIYRSTLRIQPQGQGEGRLIMVRSLPLRLPGSIEVSMRVSLFMGTGSHKPTGSQEAGLVLLSSNYDQPGSTGTLLSIGYATDETDPSRFQGYMRMIIRKDDGAAIQMKIGDRQLPLTIQEGEYGLALTYRTSDGLLQSIKINDNEMLAYLPASNVRLVLPRVVGIQAIMKQEGEALLSQYYWAIQARQFDDL